MASDTNHLVMQWCFFCNCIIIFLWLFEKKLSHNHYFCLQNIYYYSTHLKKCVNQWDLLSGRRTTFVSTPTGLCNLYKYKNKMLQKMQIWGVASLILDLYMNFTNDSLDCYQYYRKPWWHQVALYKALNGIIALVWRRKTS